MNDELLQFHGFVRSPFQATTEPGKLLQSHSISVLIDDVCVDLCGGNSIIGVRGVRGIGKTCFANLLARSLEARQFIALLAAGASASPQHVQRGFGQAAGLSEAMPDPSRLLTMLQREFTRKRLVLIVDDADMLPPAMFLYLWQMLELCRLQSIRLHLVLIGDIGVWPGLNTPALNTMRRAAISRHMIPCLTEAESAQYLDHKLSLAGRSLSDLMTRSAVRELVAESGCVPGRINELAEVALARCYENRSGRITGRTVHGAIGVASARPVLERLGRLFPRPALAAMATFLLLAGCLDIVRTLYAGPASRNASVLQAETANHSEPSPKPELFAATLLKPVDVPASAPAPPPKPDTIAGAPRPGGRGLVLVAAAGDNIANMYDRVYQGLEPPPFLDVVAANAGPIRQGTLVVFPEPPHGWVAR